MVNSVHSVLAVNQQTKTESTVQPPKTTPPKTQPTTPQDTVTLSESAGK